MKELLLLVLLCGTVSAYGQNNTWTVSLNPTAGTHFNSLQQALDTSIVMDGDILQVHGGNYGNVTISKSVIIMGAGYYLGQNGAPAGNATGATLGTVTIPEGVEDVTLMSVKTGSINISSNSLYLNRVNVGSINFEGSAAVYRNLYVDKSIFSSAYHIYTGVSSQNIFFEIENSVYSYIRDVNDATVTNCIITGFLQADANTNYSNSIFLDDAINLGSNLNSNFNYCVFVDATPPTNFPTGTNFFGADATTLFEGTTDNSPDGQWQLTENSDAKGKGAGGIDCGIFGGDDPYILSGLPPVPLIYEMNTPSTVGGTLNVNLKAKSNQ